MAYFLNYILENMNLPKNSWSNYQRVYGYGYSLITYVLSYILITY